MIYQVGLNCEPVVRNKKTMVLSIAQHRCPWHEIINIPSLLKAKCPALFENYQKLLSGKIENALVVAGNTEIDITPEDYFETDIYKASREIKKMQKVNKGILSTWYDPDTGADLLE